jgi:ribosome biogenesis GTPase
MAALGDDERRQLYKRAARVRRASQQKPGKPRQRAHYEDLDEGDDFVPFEKRRRRYKGSLRQWAEALLEDDARAAVAEIEGVAEPTSSGIVLFATGGECRVLFDGGDVRDCLVAPDLAASQRSDLAVGDRVEVAEGEGRVATVVGVLPRRSVLSRRDSGPGGRYTERVVAANVDRVVVVASARQPALRPRLLDRYLVAADRGGAGVAIAITKVDLLDACESEALLASLEPYRGLGVPVLACSSVAGTGVPALAALLQGATAVLVGQSGVGKSSLLNALEPSLRIETRATGRANKGRHTTAASTLHLLAGGTRVIDTPGIREFGLWQLSREELRESFHEFDPIAPACRYADCAHAREPACAVRAAAERGAISAGRYESYLRLLETLE